MSHKLLMPYDRCLAEGLPFATGVIEGACRHLVRDRMEITGARWSMAGAEAVLRLRSLRSSGDFDAYWKHHERMEHERNHQAKYQDGEVPELTPPTGGFSSGQEAPEPASGEVTCIAYTQTSRTQKGISLKLIPNETRQPAGSTPGKLEVVHQ